MKHSQTFDLAYSRVRTIHDNVTGITVPQICFQCIDAACMKSCPADAFYVDPEIGAVRINYNRCVGCMDCVAGCPFGDMFTEPKNLGAVFKCDLCEGDPVCARFCPEGALLYKEMEPLSGKLEMALDES
jgi:Fe-S-cluster-containing dehydrogenase component